MTLGQAIAVEGRRLAVLEVRLDLQHRGIKHRQLAHKVIVEQAKAWLVEHPELYEEAKERVERLGWVNPNATRR
jgi:hypothetical protein